MKLSQWLEDGRRGFEERVALADALLVALQGFHEREPGTRPALEPESIEIDGDECRIEAAPRRLDPATASYRAPETNEGAPYAPSADTFSMGVICYQVLAGRHPFLMENAKGQLETMTSVPAPPLRDVQPEAPRDLADAVMACLERDPEWRAKDLSYLAEVVKRSKPAGKSRGASRRAAAPASPVPSSPARAATSFRGPQPRPAPSGSRLPLTLAAVAGMLMLVGGLWYFTRPQPLPIESPRPRTTATPPPVAETTPTPVPGASLAPLVPTPRPTPSAAAPSAAPSAVPTAAPSATVEPTPRPTAAAVATPLPTSVPVVVATPTPGPVATPTPGPTPTSAPAANGPAVLTTVVPNKLKRPSTTLLDVRGSGLRPEHKALVLRGRDVAPGVSVAGMRYVSASLVQVLVKVDDGAAPGSYQLLLVDAQGQASAPRTLDVLK